VTCVLQTCANAKGQGAFGGMRSFLSLSLLLLWEAACLPATSQAHQFVLNQQNTTGYGKAWSDTFTSVEADWVLCDGDYALCFYSNCTANPSPSSWSGSIQTASCPCEVYKGHYMVMINGILDQTTWQQTRDSCPLGLLSCPLPNSAPVCQRINENSLFNGSGIEQLSLVSAWSRRNSTAHHAGVVLPKLSACEAGTYAGCMTAPCTPTSTGNTMCECPVATGPFQVSGEHTEDSCKGIPSGAVLQTIDGPDTGAVYSLVPDGCTTKPALCYEGTQAAMQTVLFEDTINCPGKGKSKLVQIRCVDAGYGLPLGTDPIFGSARIFSKHPLAAVTDSMERCESRSKTFQLSGKSALIVATSHAVLGETNCTSCKPTGAASPELSSPYYIFKDAGMSVTLASIKGGAIPMDKEAQFMTHWDIRFWNDAEAINQLLHTPSIDTLDFSSFNVVYMVGGWGAAWDLGTSRVLADGITVAYAADRVVGSVCHGSLGFIHATEPDGNLICNGRNMTGVTNRQIKQLGIIDITPMHPEDELKKAGANFMADHGVLTDLDQSLVVVDGLVVTGQNQNSACEVAQRMLDQIDV